LALILCRHISAFTISQSRIRDRPPRTVRDLESEIPHVVGDFECEIDPTWCPDLESEIPHVVGDFECEIDPTWCPDLESEIPRVVRDLESETPRAVRDLESEINTTCCPGLRE
ncbi:hypothetical protein BgiBS90_003204, partial [Biomphalaria glabrata]